jgi:hypothetical protein
MIIQKAPSSGAKTYLSLLWRPLSVGITVEYDFVTLGIFDFDSGMAQSPISLPLDIITSALCDQEEGAAALVSIVVDALWDGKVEYLATGHFGC